LCGRKESQLRSGLNGIDKRGSQMMRNTRRCKVEVRHSPSACLLTLALVIGLAWVPAGRAQSLSNPRRLADGPPGQLLVADRAGTVVAVDKDTLQPVWDFPLPGEGAPFGLAMLNRLVFVGNTETHDVEVYRLQGSSVRGMEPHMLFSLGATSPGGAGAIASPSRIAVDRA